MNISNGRIKILLIALLIGCYNLSFSNGVHPLTDTLFNGKRLIDTDGKPVNAHGAGVLYHKGVYYLFGEVKKGKTWLVPKQNWEDFRVPAGGVSCYSSTDLKHWKNRGWF
ncbi:hypothetical protein [Pedobacter riviphilus]|uniref:hypothetical protein n=1 Tax=Pedobacter riviphilus TaxID=2766984 RepID=UPI001CC26E78|nr:hypothetical protein [Pedobacter riviphilus]